MATSKATVLDSAEKCKENWKDERKNILCGILYVANVRMPGRILEY